MKQWIAGLFLLGFASNALAAEDIYKLKYKSIQGKEESLAQYKGKVLIIANTASECGYTSQYEGLEKLYKSYGAKGLTVVGFPSPTFDQELKSDKEVASFCKIKYVVTFPLSTRVSVKGKDIDPVFDFLTKSAPEKGEGQWNFEKFLVNKKGEVVGRFRSNVTPAEMEAKVKELL